MRPTTEAARPRAPARRRRRGGRAPSSGAPAFGIPASSAIAATVSGASPEITFSVMPCARKNSTVSRASRAKLLGEHDEPERLETLRRLGRVGGRSSGASVAAEGEHPPAVPGLRLGRAPRGSPSGSAPARRGRIPAVRAARRSSAAARRTAPGGDGLGLGGPGLGDRLERRVAGSASWPRSARARPRARPPVAAGGTSATTRRPASVSVPVLSRQTTSTEASDSIAFSCWASAPLRAIRSAATA